MAVVKAGKFMMRIVTFAMVTIEDKDNGYLGKGLDWEKARKKVFKGITGVEGTPEEFKQINEMLTRIPAYKKFEIEEA